MRVMLPEGTGDENESVRFDYGIEQMRLPWDATPRYYAFVARTDETGRQVLTYVDVFGSVVRETAAPGWLAEATTYTRYDVMGRVVRTYAPEGQETVYVYDTLGRLASKTSPDAGTTEYLYDDAGNLRFSRDARQTQDDKFVFTSYDFANRPITMGEVVPSFGAPSWSTLDPNVTESWESAPTWVLRLNRYDEKPPSDIYPFNLGDFASEIDGFSQSNLMGRLSATAERSGGKWLLTLYSYDDRGRVEEKRVLSEDMPDVRTVFTYAYDMQDNLLARLATVGTITHNQWFDYDRLGRLWKVYARGAASKPDSAHVSFTYTSTDRVSLKQMAWTAIEIPFQYTIRDWIHRIDDLSSPSKSFGARYFYDANGNVVTSPAPYSLTAATYDWRNLPTSLTRSGTTTEYRYNEFGQRYYRKEAGSEAEYYAMDGDLAIGVFTESDSRIHWNILAGTSIIGRRQSGGGAGFRYFVQDHLGSTRMVLTNTGTVVETLDYYPFGLAMPGRSMLSGPWGAPAGTSRERT